MKRCVHLITLCAVIASFKTTFGEWTPATPDEIQESVSLAESALTTHWAETDIGWCRFTVDGIDGDPRNVELSWDKTRVGIKVWHLPVDRNPSISSDLELIAVYGPAAQWIYNPTARRMVGYGGRTPMKIQQRYDCRPHVTWLAIMSSSDPRLTHLGCLRKMKETPLQVFRNETGRVRIQNDESMIEFDLNSGFSPVLFELHLGEASRKDGKRINPIREKYEVAQDKHGIHFCKCAERTLWRNGIDESPSVHRVLTVIEYDSQPSPDQLRLDYETIDVPNGTLVSSFVATRPGSWTYGNEKSGPTASEDKVLKDLGGKMRERGFASIGGKKP